MNDSVKTVLEEKEEDCEDLSCRGREIVGVGGGFRLRRQQGIQPIVAVEKMIP
jgi:chromosome segregation and condensation protein ScpB